MTTDEFVEKYRNDDIRKLALQGAKFPDIDMPFALNQISGWQIARTKLPAWANTKGIIYPPHISMEQCSSEQTATYKAGLIGETGSFCDLTGGFGVDFSYLARKAEKAFYVEQQPHLCDIVKHNFEVLGLNQAEVVCSDSIEYLRSMKPVDLIYLDPARRDDKGDKTYAIEDCSPNVIDIKDLLLEKAERVIIKLSPMLDWHKAVQDVGNVSQVHIISVKNECKELLLVLSNKSDETEVFCVNDAKTVRFIEGGTNIESYGLGQYLYEPNASIMKAGCFGLLCEKYGVTKAAPHSNLFFSNELKDFPGRRFEVKTITSLNKKELKTALKDIKKANVAVRNFPLTAQELRQRLKLKDGGDVYIFGTTDKDNNHILLVCKKVQQA